MTRQFLTLTAIQRPQCYLDESGFTNVTIDDLPSQLHTRPQADPGVSTPGKLSVFLDQGLKN